MTPFVQTQQRSTIFEIILNRPDKRNAINWEVMTGLEAAIIQAENTPGLRVVLLRGEGTGFSAGIDLMGFTQMSDRFGEGWRENLFPLTHAFQSIVNQFERCSLPVIALLHGYVMGLGLELALACDFRIVAEGTKMSLPESLLGLIPDVGGTTRLTRLIGPSRAKELIMTGRSVDLNCAERWGLVNYVVPLDELAERGEVLAEELCRAAPLAVSYAKRVIDGITDIERGLQLEAWAQSVLIRSEDFAAGAQAMLAKQPIEWKGK
jgi:enoyl-CoA hydratase/carnithine racemase